MDTKTFDRALKDVLRDVGMTEDDILLLEALKVSRMGYTEPVKRP